MQILESVFLGNPVRNWLIAAAIILAVAGGLSLVKNRLTQRVQRLARLTRSKLDDVLVETLASTKFSFLLFLGLWLASRTLVLPASVAGALRILIILATVLQAARWTNVAIGSFIRYRVQRTVESDPAEATTINALGILARLVIWVILGLVALANFGIEVGPLLAGLGVGGVAVALAVQNILGDLFASLSIVLDKPFVIGDFIIVDNLMGTVEHIGLKSTRLRSLTGEQVIVGNADLLHSRIRNFKRMHERRIMFELGVTYSTPADKLERLPAILREIIEAQPDARFDRSHFKQYGESSLVFETVYWMRLPDYTAYMDTQQAINLEIYRRFEEEDVQMAFPTRTVILEGAVRTT